LVPLAAELDANGTMAVIATAMSAATVNLRLNLIFVCFSIFVTPFYYLNFSLEVAIRKCISGVFIGHILASLTSRAIFGIISLFLSFMTSLICRLLLLVFGSTVLLIARVFAIRATIRFSVIDILLDSITAAVSTLFVRILSASLFVAIWSYVILLCAI
jgi:hypothetical protein